eukprot:gnl/TRDRNA2_/TRDRNA2_201096_c0_seq1.p1 gnl/TRDRNA2_/TRDRNA2_201096_c0~~gnl/TRDRNA2_/TRDRNA2_201096_c0_seq1.p1  ORF type:complete len:286 (+),score=50.84 gnl/TRDRNA2_/TRDRNA2_201096_c0_seq1:39-860(+)
MSDVPVPLVSKQAVETRVTSRQQLAEFCSKLKADGSGWSDSCSCSGCDAGCLGRTAYDIAGCHALYSQGFWKDIKYVCKHLMSWTDGCGCHVCSASCLAERSRDLLQCDLEDGDMGTVLEMSAARAQRARDEQVLQEARRYDTDAQAALHAAQEEDMLASKGTELEMSAARAQRARDEQLLQQARRYEADAQAALHAAHEEELGILVALLVLAIAIFIVICVSRNKAAFKKATPRATELHSFGGSNATRRLRVASQRGNGYKSLEPVELRRKL